MGVLKPELIMKSVVPVVMAGILGIYGMIVAVIIVQKSTSFNYLVPATGYKANAAYAHLASGLCCGFSSLVRNNLILGCWFGDWNCWRCRCKSKCSTGQDFRGNDFNFNFRLSFGFIWFNSLSYLNISRLIKKRKSSYDYRFNFM